MSDRVIITHKLRLKDNRWINRELTRQSRMVNHVWNRCNEIQTEAVNNGDPDPSGFDLINIVKAEGMTERLDISGHTICVVCQEYAKKIRQSKKSKLRWRGKKKIGWVPFTNERVKLIGDGIVRFRKLDYKTMHWHKIPEGAKLLCGGSFRQDARKNWYVNLPFEYPEEAKRIPNKKVGIDFGLKTLATLSNGTKIENPKFYRNLEPKLTKACRARKNGQVKAINAKIANCRNDYLHKAANEIVSKFGLVIVGKLPVKRLSTKKGRKGKSFHDAGLGLFKQMLCNKSVRNGGVVLEANEAMTSQSCSSCGLQDSPSRPKGIAGLGIREWECSDCGVKHDRDINAARNILRIGLDTLAEGAAA